MSMVILYEAERRIIRAWKVLFDFVPECEQKDNMNAAINQLEEFHYPEEMPYGPDTAR